MKLEFKKINRAFSLVEITLVIVIIGTLIAGITKGIDLYQDFRLVSARKITENSIVSKIGDLALWLETTSEKSFNKAILNNNEEIIEWRDINPINTDKNIIFTNAAISQRPKYQRNGLGGLPSIKFDGVDDVLVKKFDKIIDSDYSIFIVFNMIAPIPDSQDLIVFMNQYNIGSVLIEFSAYGILRASHRNNVFVTANANNLFSTDSAKFNKNYILKYIRNQTQTQTANVWLNKDLFINNLSASISGLKPDIEFYIGSLTSSGVRPFNGYISEIIIFDKTLKESDHRAVEEYLKLKYQISY